MYVQKKEITVWDCGAGHNHRTEDAAVSCLYKLGAPERNAQATKLRVQRNVRMAVSFLRGSKYQDIADAEGLSKHQTQYLINRILRRIQRQIKGDFAYQLTDIKTPIELTKDATYWIDKVEEFYKTWKS
jgi:hypothetical protein